MSKSYNGKFYCIRCHEEVKVVTYTYFDETVFDCSNRKCHKVSDRALTEKGLKEAKNNEQIPKI